MAPEREEEEFLEKYSPAADPVLAFFCPSEENLSKSVESWLGYKFILGKGGGSQFLILKPSVWVI